MDSDLRDTPEADARQEALTATITEGNVWRAVWTLSWPTMISMLLSTTQIWVNTGFVGKQVGGSALDAVMLGGQILMIVFSLTLAITVGTTALVSRFTGARSLDEAAAAAKQSIILAVFVSAILTVPSILITRVALMQLGATADVLRMSMAYTIICLISTAPFFVLLVAGAAFRGLGDVKTPLYVMAIVNGLHILGDWLLIYGPGPFPAMGVTGAAIALVASRVVGTAASLWWLRRSPLRASLSLPWTPRFEWFSRILKVAMPAFVQTLLFTLGSTAFVWVLGRLPNAAVAQAALAIGLAAEAVAYMPGFAFMTAATSLVGQNLGANRPDRAERGAWICAWQSLVVMSTMAVIFYVFAEPLTKLFLKDVGQDRAIIPLAVSYLRINAISEPFFGFGMVFTGAMQGAGDTRTPTIVAFVTMWLIRIPLAYVWAVPLHGGVAAAWIMMSATTILRGLIMIGLFRLGKWKTAQV